MHKTSILMLALFFVCGIAHGPCYGAVVAPKDEAEARTQLEQAMLIRRTMEEASAAAQRERLREEAAQDNALMAIRGNAAEAAPLAAGAVVSNDGPRADRAESHGSEFYAYMAAIAAGAALLAFVYRRSKRAGTARQEKGNVLQPAHERTSGPANASVQEYFAQKMKKMKELDRKNQA